MLPVCAALVLAVSVAVPQDVAGIMKKVAERYRHLEGYRLEGSYEISSGRNLSGAKFVVAGSERGLKRRVEYKGPAYALALITNGATTWTVLPESKQYSKIEAAAKDEEADDESPQESSGTAVDTLYTFLITHYATFDKLAPASALSGEADVKTAGGKVPCWIVTTKMQAQIEKSWIDQERFVVLRSQTVFVHQGGFSPEVTLTTKRFDLEAQDAGEFVFEPRPKDKLVDELQIPGAAPSFVGKAAADFQLKDVNGEPVRLSELRGKVVVLDFWATWCGPCRRELPTIDKLAAELKPQSVLVLGINDEGGGVVKSFNKKYQYTFTTLEDASHKVHRAYVANAIPSVFVIGKDGVIVRHFVGTREEAELRAGIQAALAH